MVFVQRIHDNPELLNEGDNRLKYHCYKADVMAYKFSKMNEELLEESKEVYYKYEECISNPRKIIMGTLYGRGGNSNE